MANGLQRWLPLCFTPTLTTRKLLTRRGNLADPQSLNLAQPVIPSSQLIFNSKWGQQGDIQMIRRRKQSAIAYSLIPSCSKAVEYIRRAISDPPNPSVRRQLWSELPLPPLGTLNLK
jgi:hypothetical protein